MFTNGKFYWFFTLVEVYEYSSKYLMATEALENVLFSSSSYNVETKNSSNNTKNHSSLQYL